MTTDGRLVAAVARDHVVRATGLSDPQWLRLLDATADVFSRADRLDFSVETSLRLQAGRVERRRYTVGLPTRALGGEASERLQRVVSVLRPPDEVVRWLRALRDADHLPSAILFGLGAADAGHEPSARIYLEQRALGGILGLPLPSSDPAAVSAEWTPGASAVSVRTYREVPSTTRGDLPSSIEGPIARLFASLRPRFHYRRADLGGGSTTAFQLVAHPTPLAAHHAELVALGAALEIDTGAIESALAATPDAILRVAAFGVTRRDAPHVTIYHGPPSSHDEPLAIDRTDVRTLPRAVVLRVARANGALEEVVISIDEPIPAAAHVANVAIYQWGAAHDLAPLIAEALSVTAHLGPTTSAAVRLAVGEKRVRAALEARGLRWLGYVVRP